jgi:transcriptional regulator with GAF, ATPase, and Fis domain
MQGLAVQFRSEQFQVDQPIALPKQNSFAGILSQSNRMQRVFTMLQRVAAAHTTVLVLGESGTGKELVAKALHELSGRKGRLVPVNCGAIPEEILESELFGHEKGAFTGATNSRIGRFQLADGGTIFLDEIGEMSPKLQVKLLRVLQEKCVEPVGGTRSIPVDVRIVAATNKDLWEEVQAGRFREDLFFRLQVVPIELPPLRDRGGDVALLAGHFLERECAKLGRTGMHFSDAAIAILDQYRWTGNVRELENLVQRLALLVDGPAIVPEDLPGYMAVRARTDCQIFEIDAEIPEGGVDFNECINSYETQLILGALEKTAWNKKAAAELLSLNRTTLVEKIKKKGLEPREPQRDEQPIRPAFGAQVAW